MQNRNGKLEALLEKLLYSAQLRLRKPRKKLSESMGITIESAEHLMEELFEEKTRVKKQYDDLADKRASAQGNIGPKVESLEMIGVRQHSESIEKSLTALREWWSLHVLEGVEVESRRLKWLTIVLIALTITLTAFTILLWSRVRP